MAARMASMTFRAPAGCVRRDSGKWSRDRRAPVRDSAPSCVAVAFPEGGDAVVGHEATAPGSVDRGLLVIAQLVDAGAPRLDFARQGSKLFLVLFGPGTHPFENVFHRCIHGVILTRQSPGSQSRDRPRSWWLIVT